MESVHNSLLGSNGSTMFLVKYTYYKHSSYKLFSIFQQFSLSEETKEAQNSDDLSSTFRNYADALQQEINAWETVSLLFGVIAGTDYL